MKPGLCEIVGRTRTPGPRGSPWTRSFFKHLQLLTEADEGVGRGPGGPPYNPARIVLKNMVTIHIPDDLARDLELIAAAQRKSVEQVALESLRSLFDAASSPEAVLRSVRKLPHPSAAAVDDLEAAIFAARLPVRDQGAFDWRSRE